MLGRHLLLGRLLRYWRLLGLGCWRGVGEGVFTTKISQRRIVHQGIKIIIQVTSANRLVKGSSFPPGSTRAGRRVVCLEVNDEISDLQLIAVFYRPAVAAQVVDQSPVTAAEIFESIGAAAFFDSAMILGYPSVPYAELSITVATNKKALSSRLKLPLAIIDDSTSDKGDHDQWTS